MLALPLAQRQLAAAANRILAPSRVEFGSIALSWNRATRINGLVLRDAQGDELLVSPRAVFNWSLSQILFAQPTDAAPADRTAAIWTSSGSPTARSTSTRRSSR